MPLPGVRRKFPLKAAAVYVIFKMYYCMRGAHSLTIEELRKEIDKTDGETAQLFERRMELCAEIAEEKSKSGLPVFDSEREKSMLASCKDRVSEKIAPLYRELLEKEIALSKRYQRGLISALPENVTLENGCLSEIGRIFDLNRKVLLVTDSGVPAGYAKAAAEQCKAPVCVVLPQGEKTKSVETMVQLCEKMLEHNFDRGDCVLAVGGGVVGDIAGFSAACYMRGIDFYNVPTTLLAMADSCIGGKTAANLCGIKNIVGAFYPPRAVAIDPALLKTLDERQFKNGLAEVIKTAACLDTELFEMLEHGLSTAETEEAVRRCVLAKSRIVEEDRCESGLRRVLNFGHTIGHAIESAGGGSLLHGECVAMGMLPMCESGGAKEWLAAVLKKYGFETKFGGDKNAVFAAFEHDKKAEKEKITAVVLKNIGEYEFVKMSTEEIKERFAEVIK